MDEVGVSLVHGGDAERCGVCAAGAEVVHHQVNVPAAGRWGGLRLERIPLFDGEDFAEFVGMNRVRETAMVPICQRGDAMDGGLSGKQPQ